MPFGVSLRPCAPPTGGGGGGGGGVGIEFYGWQ